MVQTAAAASSIHRRLGLQQRKEKRKLTLTTPILLHNVQQASKHLLTGNVQLTENVQQASKLLLQNVQQASMKASH